MRLARGHLEVGELLRVEAAPGRALGGRGRRVVRLAPDQVEERRRELERARAAALREQARHEGGRGVGRRLLLVLAVVAGAPLASVEPPDGERGPRPPGASRSRAARAAATTGDASRSRSARGRARTPVRRLPPRRPLGPSPLPPATFMPAVERNAERGTSARSSTNWWAGTSTARRFADVGP